MSTRAYPDTARTHRRIVSLPFLLEGWVDSVPSVSVNGLCSEVRLLQPGDALIAHNAEDAAKALALGAGAVLHDAALPLANPGVPTIAVANLAKRLPAMAARFHHHPADQLQLAALAGPAGRTEAAWYIAQSWQRGQASAGLIGSLGSGSVVSLNAPSRRLDALGLHRTLAACVADGAQAVALEVTPRMLAGDCLTELPIDVAVYTGAGGGDDAVGLQPLFDRHAPRFAVINHDEAEGKLLVSRARDGIQVLTYGSNGATELQGSILSQDSTGMNIRIASPWGGGELRTGLLGNRCLSSLMAAAGALALMGMPWNRVMHQLEIMSPVPGQMSCIAGEGARPAAVIDHARTPHALEQVLRELRSHLHGRLFCILHSGGGHRRALADVASSLADEVHEVSGSTRSAVLRGVLRRAGRHDIVLIAGGGKGDWAQQGEAEVRHLLEEAA
ncbi:MAG: hypothetical protein HKO85_03995 [Xanthomonadales bacterium]|nr:hypothetical protein [Xanthomonadales bacterium]